MAALPILPGTVRFLALSAIERAGPLHGFEILQWVRERSGDELQIEEGALYPALHQMADRGLLESEWGVSEKGRRAKYYRITAAGRRTLAEEARSWARYVTAVGRVVPDGSGG